MKTLKLSQKRKIMTHQKRLKNNFIRNGSESEEVETSTDKDSIVVMPAEPTARLVGLSGEIEEEKCAGIIGMLYSLKESGKNYVAIEPENPETDYSVEYDPIEFLISTEGGSVPDMFAVYDVMRDINKDCEINTFGVGKVMSAGLILLAAGTPGKRRIGKYCRLMIHPVSAGNFGQLHELEISQKEVKILQEDYIDVLSELSQGKLSKEHIKKLFKRKGDTYFNAQQAVLWGLADLIV